MGWKRKEKELTPEEALALAKSEAAPFWIESSPLFSAVAQENGELTVHPLNSTFAEENWVIVAADLTSYSGRNAVATAQRWNSRYKTFGVKTLILFASPAPYANEKTFVSALMSEIGSQLPVVIDANGLFRQFFASVSGKPKAFPPFAVYLQKGVPLFSLFATEPNWEADFELTLQRHLRTSDPGLPLPPPIIPEKGRLVDRGSVHFTNNSRVNQLLKKTLGVEVTGNWEQAADHWHTSDSSATLTLKSPAEGLLIIGKWMIRTVEAGRVIIEVEGAPAYENFAGANLRFDEGGQSFVDLRDLSTQQALINLPPEARQLVFRIPNAKRTPVALYGLRFFGPETNTKK